MGGWTNWKYWRNKSDNKQSDAEIAGYMTAGVIMAAGIYFQVVQIKLSLTVVLILRVLRVRQECVV